MDENSFLSATHFTPDISSTQNTFNQKGIRGMKFLTEKEIGPTVRKLLKESSSLNAAVAFWGKGASKELGLADHAEKVSVVCNLGMGGTNPDEIDNMRELMEVLHRDDLHAKVYLFENAVIIGSSNASSNGLSYQTGDNQNWSEANVLIEDSAFVAEVALWFNDIAGGAAKVKKADIEQARNRWVKRRKTRVISGNDLLSAAKSDPEQFEDSNVLVCINTQKLSAKAVNKRNEVRQTLNSKSEIDCYEGWGDIPKNAILIDFNVEQSKTGKPVYVTYNGIWKTPKKIISEPIDSKSSIQICLREEKVQDLEIGDPKKWREAAKEAAKAEDFDWDFGALIPLTEFSKRYLQDA